MSACQWLTHTHTLILAPGSFVYVHRKRLELGGVLLPFFLLEKTRAVTGN